VKEQLSEHGQAFVRVTGTSMQPLLQHLRDGVVLIPPKEIRRGDIVLFDRKNGRYALHRVIRKGKTGFSMAGDHQWHMEENLPYDQVIGVVSCIQRKGKSIPRDNFFLRAYGATVTMMTRPRIKIWKGIVWAGRMIRHKGKEDRKGAG
jgi:signal peptidase I